MVSHTEFRSFSFPFLIIFVLFSLFIRFTDDAEFWQGIDQFFKRTPNERVEAKAVDEHADAVEAARLARLAKIADESDFKNKIEAAPSSQSVRDILSSRYSSKLFVIITFCQSNRSTVSVQFRMPQIHFIV